MEVVRRNCNVVRHGEYRRGGVWTRLPPHGSRECIRDIMRVYEVRGCGYPVELSGLQTKRAAWMS